MDHRWRNGLLPALLTLWCGALAALGSLLTQWPLRLEAVADWVRPALAMAALGAFLLALLRPWTPGWRRRLATYRLAIPCGGAAGVALLVAAVLVVNYGALILLAALLEPEPIWIPILEGILLQPLGLVLLLILLVLAAPLIEELLLRGRLQRGLERRWGLPAALLVGATVFAWLHGVPGLVPVYLVFGVMLGLAVWLTRSIWTGIALHALHNGLILGLFLLARSADWLDAAMEAPETDTLAALQLGGAIFLAGVAVFALAMRLGNWPRLRSPTPAHWRVFFVLLLPLGAVNVLPAF